MATVSRAVPRAGQSPVRALLSYDSAKRPHPFREEILELYRYRELAWQWAKRNIKLRYKRSALGVLWTLIEPLMLMTILTIVFSRAFHVPIDNFPVYLLSGLLLFDFLQRSTLQIVDEIIESQNLAKRIYVPRSAFAVATIGTYLFNWLIALLPLAAITLWSGLPLSWASLTVPIGILLTALFALGLGLLVATAGAFFHDIKLTYQVMLTAWFYATPIIYPIEIVEGRLRTLLELNPLFHLSRIVRDPVFLGQVAPLENWLWAISISLLSVLGGWWTFTHWRNAFDYRT